MADSPGDTGNSANGRPGD